MPFLVHFHPSVSLFAERLLSDQKMPPKPDLTSHSLIRFLDRFVYRNPKATTGSLRGSSIMQPLSGGDSKGALLSNRSTQNGQVPLNTEAFWRQKAEDVAVDEVFFHKYFSQIGKVKQMSKKKTPPNSSGRLVAEDEDQDEEEIWQALVDSRPEVEGPSDDDSDMEMLDLDDSDSETSGDSSDGADAEGSEAESVLEASDGLGAFSDSDFEDDGESGASLEQVFRNELEVAQRATHAETAPETSRQKKRRLKGLPTFASVDAYAEMLNSDQDEDI
jgi:ribosome biogenesis protein MAK21